MHPNQHALLNLARQITASLSREAGVILWKYTDEEAAKDFYLKVKKQTVRSPWTGKTFAVKPKRVTIGDVGKELKADEEKLTTAVWKYVDGDGNEFYLQARTTKTLKSPFTGRAFTPKPEKDPLTDVSRELREESKGAAPASGTGGGAKAATPRPARKTKKASDDPAWKL